MNGMYLIPETAAPGKALSAAQAALHLGRGLGVTAAVAIDKVHVFAVLRRHHQAGHDGVIGKMHAVMEITRDRTRFEIAADGVDPGRPGN